MGDYISRNALWDGLHSGNIVIYCRTPHEVKMLCKLAGEIDRVLLNIPAADVQPVRHGRWVEVKGFTGVEAFGYREECVDGLACSVCGKEVDVSEGYFRYCPNCGAKMEVTE